LVSSVFGLLVCKGSLREQLRYKERVPGGVAHRLERWMRVCCAIIQRVDEKDECDPRDE
jgi:hypothetical protein